MYTHAASGVNLRCEVFVDQIHSLEILHQTLNVYVGHRSALKMEGCVCPCMCTLALPAVTAASSWIHTAVVRAERRRGELWGWAVPVMGSLGGDSTDSK